MQVFVLFSALICSVFGVSSLQYSSYFDENQEDGGGPLQQQHSGGPSGYFAGLNQGSTQSERMLWAAATNPNSKVNCKKCDANDLFCLSKCAAHVVTAKVIWAKKGKASVKVICSLKSPDGMALVANSTAAASATSKTAKKDAKKDAKKKSKDAKKKSKDAKKKSKDAKKKDKDADKHKKNSTATPSTKSKKSKSWFGGLLENLKGTFGIKQRRHHKKKNSTAIAASAASNSSTGTWMDDMFKSFDYDEDEDESYFDGTADFDSEGEKEDESDFESGQENDEDDSYFETENEEDSYFELEDDGNLDLDSLLDSKPTSKKETLDLSDIGLESEEESPAPKQAPSRLLNPLNFFNNILQRFGLVKIGQGHAGHGKIVTVTSITTPGPDGQPHTKTSKSTRLFKRGAPKADKKKAVTIKYGTRSGCKKEIGKKGDVVFLFLSKGRHGSYSVHVSRRGKKCPGVSRDVNLGQTRKILQTVGRNATGKCLSYSP